MHAANRHFGWDESSHALTEQRVSMGLNMPLKGSRAQANSTGMDFGTRHHAAVHAESTLRLHVMSP